MLSLLLSLVLSTVAFFVASHYVKRYLDEMDIPKSFTRSVVVFLAAAIISYGVAWMVDWVVPGSPDLAGHGVHDLQNLLKK